MSSVTSTRKQTSERTLTSALHLMEGVTMTLVAAIVVGWLLLCAFGMLAASALCRAGHLEDEALGYLDADLDPDLYLLLIETPELAGQVTDK